ncbi:MAG: hypothetical protein GX246_02910 [Clostridiales bacterium]|jgi:hypothetical protein|nr:hypothetical protein [Bacillota bacterium]NLL54081.1 hypothetical protein [Clostridiales bacterium]
MRVDYVPNLKAPRRKGPSKRMLLTILLCILLPPVGLVLLWGGVKCPVRGKLLLTLISALILVAMFTTFLVRRERAVTIIPQPVIPHVLATPTPAAAAPAPDMQVPQGIIPANPMG